MVQYFDLTPTQSAASMIGQALGTGISKNFVPPEQRVQMGLLQQAMNDMQGQSTYEGKLNAILPKLATTPGGSEILSALMPLMQRQAQSQAYIDYQNKQMGNQAPGQMPNMQNQGGIAPQVNTPYQTQGNQPVVNVKNPQSTISPESTYPSQTAGPQPTPLMSPQEMQQKRKELAMQYAAAGQPIDPGAIENIIQTENESRRKNNEQIQLEKERRAESWDVLQAQAMKRAVNGDLFEPGTEDQNVFEKFVNESKNAANPNQIYNEAKAKFRKYESAKNAITNEYDVPGQATKLWRKMTGSYKSKEDLQKSLQPHIKTLKDLGLITEARNLLSNSLGFGAEDVESTLYPPTKQELNSLNTFSNNPNKGKIESFAGQAEARFPGEESALSPENYSKFKDKIENFLNQNPEMNLISMRGNLNQNKGYGWQDINRAVVDLIEEGRFQPNDIQEQQLNVIKQPPAPGLMGLFKNLWKGTR